LGSDGPHVLLVDGAGHNMEDLPTAWCALRADRQGATALLGDHRRDRDRVGEMIARAFRTARPGCGPFLITCGTSGNSGEALLSVPKGRPGNRLVAHVGLPQQLGTAEFGGCTIAIIGFGELAWNNRFLLRFLAA